MGWAADHQMGGLNFRAVFFCVFSVSIFSGFSFGFGFPCLFTLFHIPKKHLGPAWHRCIFIHQYLFYRCITPATLDFHLGRKTTDGGLYILQGYGAVKHQSNQGLTGFEWFSFFSILFFIFIQCMSSFFQYTLYIFLYTWNIFCYMLNIFQIHYVYSFK